MFTFGLSNCKFNHFAPTIHHLLTFFDIITRFSALIINEIGKTGGIGVVGVLGELRELRVLRLIKNNHSDNFKENYNKKLKLFHQNKKNNYFCDKL